MPSLTWRVTWGVDPEEALRGTNRKFEGRFQQIEAAFPEGLKDVPLEAMEQAWQAAKKSDSG